VSEDGLYGDPDLARFYDLENGWSDDLDYCRDLARGCSSVLDLGCGTGLFAAALAQQGEVEVVGVDPAKAMLDIAARRPGGERVRWIEGDARDLRLDRRFDLVVLTGHAFQVFLTDADRAAVLATIACHLAPEGRFVFDSRNPRAQAWMKWTPDHSRRRLDHPEIGKVEAWNDVSHDPATDIVAYGTYYKVDGGERVYASRSKIAFPSQAQIAFLMDGAGLVVLEWLGDWSGGSFTPTSPEIIPVGGLKRR
jgi:SAM-dependent methyltransferase